MFATAMIIFSKTVVFLENVYNLKNRIFYINRKTLFTDRTRSSELKQENINHGKTIITIHQIHHIALKDSKHVNVTCESVTKAIMSPKSPRHNLSVTSLLMSTINLFKTGLTQRVGFEYLLISIPIYHRFWNTICFQTDKSCYDYVYDVSKNVIITCCNISVSAYDLHLMFYTTYQSCYDYGTCL
ncbi:hypothetical protein BDF21DRAFT_400665 [Thamnidium elegans]|nr:hypothetical protein BDF21DRAFT_400665 [Thamnidium elegans]